MAYLNGLLPQEATADELEEAYRSEVWNPGKGRVQLQKSAAVQAARVELHTFTNEAKVPPPPQPPSALLVSTGSSGILFNG